MFDKIRGVLERPAYQKNTMFDSKAIAAKASLSPVAFARTINSNDEDSVLDLQATKATGDENHESHLLLPTTKNFILPKRLTVSPRRLSRLRAVLKHGLVHAGKLIGGLERTWVTH